MSDSSVTIKAVTTDNAVMQTIRDGRPELLVLNRSVANFDRHELFTWHLGIAMRAQAVDTDGMPAPGEIEIVNEVSEAVTMFVLAGKTPLGAPNVLFLAQSTWNGVRELLFRVHDPVAAIELISKKTFETWKRNWEFLIEEDPEWQKVRALTNSLA